MPDAPRAPVLDDLQRMSTQIATDRELSMAALRQRDHAIGARCPHGGDLARLTCWIDAVTPDRQTPVARPVDPATVATLLRFGALLAGALVMLGFMLASDRALVNVFVFLLLFVVMQLVFSLGAALVMLRTLRGGNPGVFALNPARLVLARAMPDDMTLRDHAAVGRLLLLRYGQELGALFTCGAMLGFIGALGFTDFSFVWGSTFGVSDGAVEAVTGALGAPWSGWLPAASVSPEMIAVTRYQPALPDLATVSDDNRRGWWPFLLMCMAVYALLPRLLLWLVSRLAFRRELGRALVQEPGAAAVLSRMRAPDVSTRATEAEAGDGNALLDIDEGVMLLDWAGALRDGDLARLDGLARVPEDNRFAAGLGSPDDDQQVVQAINRYRPETLLVAVRAWEPPMADLADVLAGVQGVAHCSLCLVPLPGRTVTEHSAEEWSAFARELPLAKTSADALRWN
jgi:hypothetical protein